MKKTKAIFKKRVKKKKKKTPARIIFNIHNYFYN